MIDFLALLRVPRLGNVRARRLLGAHGGASAVFAAGPSAWRAVGCPEPVCAALASPDRVAAQKDAEWLDGGPDRHLIAFDDPRYPETLAEIPQAPLALFARGLPALLSRPQIAVVGARSASAQGIENARAFAAGLGRRGIVITSGLALGIDAAAHRGALDVGAGTIAVCGNGLDRVYPARNRSLAHDIAECGLLLSEFAPGTPPKPEHFPRRNRIISGLSLGVLVVEAMTESGSLITARLAADQGRDVFAIPGSIHNPLAHGCHALIRDGAKLTESIDDILTELPPEILPSEPALTRIPDAPPLPTNALQAQIVAAIGHETLALDDLLERVRRPVAEVNAALLGLELDGIIAVGPGERFMLLQRREL